MSTINENTRTHDCMTPSCAGTAKSNRGIHAYCASCQSERQRNRVAEPHKLGDSHASRVQTLLSAARNLDRAEAKARHAVVELKKAREKHTAAARAILGESA